MMDIQIKQASLAQKPIIKELLLVYLYELGKSEEEYRYLDLYWEEPQRIPYLIYIDMEVAGFVFVNAHNILEKNEGAKAIAEFFVSEKYRNKGVGEKVAFMVFDKIPGKWEVTVMKENRIGLKFWEKVIKKYTRGKFKKVVLDNEAWKGPVYSFNNTQLK